MVLQKTRLFSVLLLSFASLIASAQDTLRIANVEAILYTNQAQKQPLIVGLGGSEGGNAWASNKWKSTRDSFLQQGYAFLAIGYFGCKGTPKILDRIAIEDVYKAISLARKQGSGAAQKVAVIGGSRGADLALLLASYYPDINAIVGLSSSHAVFPGHTESFNTSCWTFQGKELPFVPVNEEAIPFLIKRDLRGAFEAMLKDTIAERKALIPVAKINGPILLMSATKDEIIPAVAMGNQMMAALKKANFKHPYKHLVFEGSHEEPTKHFDQILKFLEVHFKNQ